MAIEGLGMLGEMLKDAGHALDLRRMDAGAGDPIFAGVPALVPVFQ